MSSKNISAVNSDGIMGNRLKGLNGIRALAALILLWGHTFQADFGKWGGGLDDLQIPLPVCCAYIFFVLSGFLAGYRCKPVSSVSAYYKKKAKRLLPLYYSYIIISIVVFSLLGRSDEILNKGLWLYIIPFPNIPFCTSTGILPLVHLWFLGSLIFFYLVFPFFTRIKESRLLYVSAAICISWALAKWGIYALVGKDTFLYRFWGTSGIDCLFGGVFLGLLAKGRNPFVERLASSKAVCLIAWILFLTSGLYGNHIPAPVRTEFMAVITMLMIISQMPAKPIVSLDNRLCEWLGDISFEIYVSSILLIILLSALYESSGVVCPAIVIWAVVTFVVIACSKAMNFLLKLIE
ncbi:MAG: acyltransferase [Bacteroidales bacterium]|nr:acyltransferase [Candidatus Cacconaster merdequi]